MIFSRHPKIPSEPSSSTATKAKYHHHPPKPQHQPATTIFVNTRASPHLSARSIRSSSSIRSSLSSGTTSSGSTDVSSVVQLNNNAGYYTRMQGNAQTPIKQQRSTDRRRKPKDTIYTDVEINSFPHGNLQMRGYSNTEY